MKPRIVFLIHCEDGGKLWACQMKWTMSGLGRSPAEAYEDWREINATHPVQYADL